MPISLAPELDADTPVGRPEIAALLGVIDGTVDQWRYRGDVVAFPDPEPSTVGGRPWWRWGRILEWAERTDRLPLP